MNQEKAIA